MPSQGRQNIPIQDNENRENIEMLPCGGGGMEEPNEDDGRVFEEGEAIVENVLVPGALLLGIEEHENVDDT